MNLLKISWKNLTSKPLSMLLSLVLFALGVGLISMLFLLNKQLSDKFEKNQAGIDLVIGAKGSPLQMILCSMYQIDAPTGNISIKDARPFMNPKHPLIKQAVPLSLGDSHKGYRIVGTNEEYPALYGGEIGEGRMWNTHFEVTVGAGVAEDLNIQIGDQFHSSHGFVNDENLIHDDGEKFKVVGIFKPTGAVLDQVICTTNQTIWMVHNHEGHDHGEDGHAAHDGEGNGEGTAHAHSHDDHDHHHDNPPNDVMLEKALIDETEQEITTLLVKYKNKKNWQSLNMPRNIDESTSMKSANPAYEINRLYSMMGVGLDSLKMLAYVIFFVSGLSVFISLFNSLKERKYELALMRVMGASRVKLFSLIVLEGLILAVLGYIIGIIISHLSLGWLAGYMKSSYRYTFTGKMFLPEEWYLLLVALGIGLLAAIIPAIQASNTDISSTLTKS